MTTVVLEIEDQTFSTTKELLSFHSPFFKAMFEHDFKEKNKSQIKLSEVDPSAMGMILDIIHTEHTAFTKCEEKLLSLLEASCMYQFDVIRDTCIDYIIHHWLCNDNVIQTMFTADKLSLTELYRKAKIMSLWNFSLIRTTDAFLYLDVKCLIEYLDSDNLRTTGGEYEVFEAACLWLNHCLEERIFYTYDLLSVVRFKLCNEFDLRSMRYYSLISDTPQAQLILEYLLKLKLNIAGDCEACVLNKEGATGKDELNPGSPGSLVKRRRSVSMRCTCTDSATVDAANKLLIKGCRTLPLVPCVVANKHLKPQRSSSSSSSLHSSEIFSTSKVMKEKVVSPYVFYWNGKDLTPEVLLTKIDEGPCEAIGYRTLCKDLKLFVVGGEYLMGYGSHNTSIWVYDTWRETWAFETSLPKAVRNHTMCSVGDSLYIIGGVGKHRVIEKTLQIYNLVDKQWTMGPMMPQAMYSAACCVYKDHIFIFGSIIVSFRPDTFIWTVMNNIVIPNNLSVASAMTHDEWIYVIANTNPDLYRFLPYAEHVKVEHLGRFKIEGKNACLVNNRIFKFGFDSTDYSYNLESYDIETGEFKVLWECTETDIGLDTANEGCFPLPMYYGK